MALTKDQEALRIWMLNEAVNHPAELAKMGMSVDEAREIAASA